MLLDLPVNILSEVLALLDHCSTLRYSAVCKQLHALVATSLNLQYRIELAAGGLIDGPPRGPASTATARMDLLLERRVAWRVMRPRRRAAVALAGPCHAYELAGGLFAKAIEEFGAARRLVASWLPSNTADETRLVIDDLGVRIKDFALDPSQDLIVFLKHRPAASASSSVPNSGAGVCVHLRKLSAGAVAPHPAAKVVEDIVGVYFRMPLHGVLIWNWMTGEELVFIQGDYVPERIWEFSFLSPRAYMITTLKDGGEIRIYSFASPSSPRQPTHVATLHLPTTTPTQPVHSSSSQRQQGPSSRIRPPGRRFGAHRGRWQPACFVMHNRTLMRYVEAYRDDGAGAMDVPGFGTSTGRVTSTCANVRTSRAPTVAEKLAASRLGIDLKEPVEGSRLVCEPSVFPATGIFAEEVVTRLPYYSVPAPGQLESYVGYMIDEKRLLGLKASPFADGDLCDVDVYTF
ncbi:hypothetical protein EDB85DRAFT_2146374 [Lactarius pseudohatsudake]|nr:hypothetical protein EDB85DRAFT_2146374 [Lactarius pseudohatsudake]